MIAIKYFLKNAINCAILHKVALICRQLSVYATNARHIDGFFFGEDPTQLL